MAKSVAINHSEMAKLLKGAGRYAGIRDELTRRAERVLAAAKADPHDDTYAYENGLHIVQDTTDRAAVRVVAGDKKGPLLEAEYGILARALDAAK